MASHSALASSRIPSTASLRSKRLDVAEFNGLRSSSSMAFASQTRDQASFSELVAAQLSTKESRAVRGETVAKLKVAINGFGRIGRNFLRCWHGRKNSPLEVIVVNDSGGVKNASHLLKYDSMLGTFKADVRIEDKETISVDGKPIRVVANRDPLKLPWADLGIDIVIEGTGVFVDGPGAGKHIQAGAKKVIITAPAKGADIPTYVVGVNEGDYSHEVSDIISNASCTTNCLAPFVKVIDEEFGIVKGTMTTTHSYTGDQYLRMREKQTQISQGDGTTTQASDFETWQHATGGRKKGRKYGIGAVAYTDSSSTRSSCSIDSSGNTLETIIKRHVDPIEKCRQQNLKHYEEELKAMQDQLNRQDARYRKLQKILGKNRQVVTSEPKEEEQVPSDDESID